MKHASEITRPPSKRHFSIWIVESSDSFTIDTWLLSEVRRAIMFMERLIITDMKDVQHTYKCYGRTLEVAASICRDIQRARDCGQWENKELGELCKRLAAV